MFSNKHLIVSLSGIAMLLLLALQFSACSSSSSSGTSIGPNDPFSGLAVNQTIQAPSGSLQHPVEVIRDTYGIPHIYGSTITDVAFAQGYVQASDRLFEMDMFRHIGDGTLTEYLGNLPGVIDEDIHSRILGFSAVAPMVYAQSSPELQSVLTSFCNGINAYVAQLKQQVQQNPGTNPLPYEYSVMGITVTDIKPFTPLDIIAFGKYMSYSLSGEDDGTKITLTTFLQGVGSTFTPGASPGLAHFSGLAYDIMRSEPAAKAPAVPLPNPFAKPGTTTSLNNLSVLSSSLVKSSTNQYSKPAIDPASLKGALNFYHSMYNGPMGVFFKPQPLGKKGSNNWTISPSLTKDGYAMLANDTHLQLYNPPIFYEVQDNTQTIGNGNINVAGVVFPLAPGVIVGHNDNIAWGVTVFGPDIIDIYNFTVTTGSPDTISYDGSQIPITAVPLSFTFGGLFNGNKVTTGTVDVYYVTLPGMGSLPLIPGSYTPGSTSALGLTWTGFLPSNELGAFFGIDQAQDLNQFIAAQSQFKLGAQNFVYADTAGNIYLTDQCTIPVRGAGTMVTATAVLPTGIPYADYLNPPYLILPAGSAFTWTGFLPAAAIPFTTNPSVGYIATANQDTVGVTYNNEPLDNPNYLGAFFDPGFRAQEINDDINANKPNIDFNVIQNTMQADHTDTYAKRILPFLQAAYNYFTANSLTVTTMETQAMGYLNQWTFDTPTGISETTQQINDSIATSIYEGFAQALFQDVYKDKFAALGMTDPPGIVDFNLVTSLLKALEYPTETALYSPARNQSMLFDKLVPNGGGGYTYTARTVNQVMMESLQAGLDQLSTNVFKTADMTQWLWGNIHTLTFMNLLNSAGNLFPQINLPSNGTGYPRPGSNYTVDPGELGPNDFQMNYPTDYTYSSGPAIRFSVEMKPGNITAYNVLPGGESGLGSDLSKPPKHYGDQAGMWVANQEHPEWFYPKDIIAHTESRTIFNP